MPRVLILTIGIVLCAAAALAAADIPTRYSGSFPSIKMAQYSVTNIVGTYTGKRFAFKGRVNAGGNSWPASASYNCSLASATETRCVGTFQGEGKQAKSSEVVIGWKAGRPISMIFSKS